MRHSDREDYTCQIERYKSLEIKLKSSKNLRGLSNDSCPAETPSREKCEEKNAMKVSEQFLCGIPRLHALEHEY